MQNNTTPDLTPTLRAALDVVLEDDYAYFTLTAVYETYYRWSSALSFAICNYNWFVTFKY